MSVLETFHQDCAEEIKNLNKGFNILFYGYGCKQKLLKRMFPGSLILNCYSLSINEVMNLLRKEIETKLNRVEKKRVSKFNNIEFYRSTDSDIIIILLNFRSEFTFLQNTKFKIMATTESMIPNLTFDDITSYNFILRDLTTFVPYTIEIGDILLKGETSNLQSALSVLKSVSKKAKQIFLAMIGAFEVNKVHTLNKLVSSVGKRFLITKAGMMKDILHEFFDHKILKLHGGNDFCIYLSKNDCKKILKGENK